MKKTLLAVAVICGTAGVFAQSDAPTDVPARARGAQRVVVGHVLDVHSQFQTNRFGDRLIVSNVLVEVSETLKGAAAPVLQLSVEGGTVGDLTLKVSDMPALNSGDRAVFFLDPDGGTGMHIPHDRGHGVLKLNGADQVQGTTMTLDAVRQQVRDGLARGAQR